MDDDENDSTRMLTVGFGPVNQPLTQAQKLQSLIAPGYKKHELARRTDINPNQAAMTGEVALWLAQREMKLKKPPLYDAWGQPVR